MPRDWKPRPAPKPTSITEICRRYYACALALSKVMGVPLTETFMQAYHSAISSTFIETSRCELRLPAGVTLPPLVPPNGQGARQPEASNPAIAEAVGVDKRTIGRDLSGADAPLTPSDEASQEQEAGADAPPDEDDEEDEILLIGRGSGEGEDVVDDADEETAPGHPPAVPTSIPSDGDLPCAGQEIATLKPAALAMLIAKTATLAHREGAGWAPLLAALTREREARLARGQWPRAVSDAPG